MVRIGMDLGGTFIKAGLVSDDFRLIMERTVPTGAERTAEEVADTMIQVAEEMIRRGGIPGNEIRGIGVGSPGAIDPRSGIVLFSNNFGWENVPLKALLSARTEFPVRLANDAQCAVMGEWKAGAGKNCGDLILLTLGTGVGSGLILDGKLFTGGDRSGGIIGHMVIEKNGRPCNCGRKGCLEAYASATALTREMERVARERPESPLGEKVRALGPAIDAKLAFDQAQRGDPDAEKIVREFISSLGEGITNLVNLFRPDKVLISGGICNQGDALFIPLNRFVRERCYAREKVFIPPVERAVLGNRAGIIGAASLLDESGHAED